MSNDEAPPAVPDIDVRPSREHPWWCDRAYDDAASHGFSHEGRPVRFRRLDDPLTEIAATFLREDVPGWFGERVDRPAAAPSIQFRAAG